MGMERLSRPIAALACTSLLALGLASATAKAAILTYEFSGNITQATFFIPAGTPFSGSFTFDTSVTTTDSFDNVRFEGALIAYDFIVGGFSGTATNGYIQQHLNGSVDQWYARTDAAHGLTGTGPFDLPLFESYFRLQGPAGSLFDSATAPL